MGYLNSILKYPDRKMERKKIAKLRRFTILRVQKN